MSHTTHFSLSQSISIFTLMFVKWQINIFSFPCVYLALSIPKYKQKNTIYETILIVITGVSFIMMTLCKIFTIFLYEKNAVRDQNALNKFSPHYKKDPKKMFPTRCLLQNLAVIFQFARNCGSNWNSIFNEILIYSG